MTASVRSQPIPRPSPSPLLRDLLATLFGSLILGLVLWLPTASPPFTRLYRNLHPLESSPIGSYAWSQPDFTLYLPLGQVARHALVRQQMTAGATPDATRSLRVSAAPTTLTFVLQGGTPLRTYTYLVPVTSRELEVQFSIDPLDQDRSNDKRVLGLVLADTQVRLLETRALPGPSALALLTVPLALLVVGLGLGVGPWRRPALLLITLALAAFYWADPYAVLPTTLPLNGGLLMLAALGALCRRLLAQVSGDAVGNVLLWSLAAVIGPWTYVAAGLWRNLGRQWIAQPVLAGVLLSLPLLAAALSLWVPALRRRGLALAALALAGVLGWGLLNLRFEISHAATDFSAYYFGAQRLLAGQPLYELERLREGPFSLTYKYHPAFIAFVLPVALAPLDTAVMLWRGLGLLWISISITIIIATQPPAVRLRMALLGLIIGANLAPIGQTLRLGQTDPLIFVGIVTALALLNRYPWVSAGIWGVLGLIKIYPLFLLFPMLLQRAWRWLVLVGAMLLLGGVASLALGWENQQTYWRDVVPLLGERNGSLANQGLYGLIVRSINPEIIRDTQANVPTPAATVPYLALVALIVGFVLWLIWRGRLWRLPWEATSLLICTMLLIMPVSWDHYETLLLLPLLMGAAHTLREPGRPSFLLLAAYALLAFGMIKNLWQGTTTPTTFGLLFATYRTLGLGLLWGWWVRYAYVVRLPA